MCPSAFIHRPISPGSQHSPGTAFPSVTWLWLVWFGDPDHVRSPGGVKFTPPHVLMYHSVRYTTLRYSSSMVFWYSRIIHLWNILYIPSDDGIYTTFEYTFEIYTSEGAFGASEQNNTPVEYTFGIYDLYYIQGIHPLVTNPHRRRRRTAASLRTWRFTSARASSTGSAQEDKPNCPANSWGTGHPFSSRGENQLGSGAQ